MMVKKNPNNCGVNWVILAGKSCQNWKGQGMKPKQINALAETILNSVGDSLITFDKEDRITAINPAAAKLLDLDAGDALGQRLSDLLPDHPDNKNIKQLLEDYAGDHTPRRDLQTTLRLTDGRSLALELGISPLMADADQDAEEGSYTGSLLVFRESAGHESADGGEQERQAGDGELHRKYHELSRACRNLQEHNKYLLALGKNSPRVKLYIGLFLVFGLIAAMIWTHEDFDDTVESLMGNSSAQLAETKGLRQVHTVKGDIRLTVSAAGVLNPLKLLSVSNQVAGRILECSIQPGQHVSKDQLLFKLDPSEVLPKLRRAEAEFLQAQDKVYELEHWHNRSEYRQAYRALQLAELELKRKREKLAGDRRLVKQGIIPAQELEEGKDSLLRAKSQLDSARESLENTAEKASHQKLRIAKLQMMNAKASLDEAKAQLAHTTITAPAAGVVMHPKSGSDGKKDDFPSVGDSLTAGKQLLIIGVDRPLGVRAEVDEAAVRWVHAGQKVLVYVKALSKEPLSGEVISVAPEATRGDQRPRFPVIVQLNELPAKLAGSLRLGMSASVQIITQEAMGVIKAPIVAVSSREKGPSVRMRTNSRLKWQVVETGLSDREFVEIKKGVKADQVLWY
jgi:PAS domain S-box-containing protein